MIGQKNLINWIDNCKSLPRFIVIVGDVGSGKKTLAKYIAGVLNCKFILPGCKTESVRDILSSAKEFSCNLLYCVEDLGTMRAEAKNSLLKITEEPPENVYIILTVTDESVLLDTLKSRATVLNMEEYSYDDYLDYAQSKGKDYDVSRFAVEVSDNLYEYNLIVNYGIEFTDYIRLVLENIGEVESANAFKSANQLILKEGSGKYELKLFWKVFMLFCYRRMDKNIVYAKYIIITSKYLNEVSRLGVNKQMLYDNWVFDIRGVGFEE